MISTSIFPFIQEILEFQKKMTSSVTECLKITEKSHSTLRAKRATFTFCVDKSSLKMPKMVDFCGFLNTLSLQTLLPDRSFLLGQKLVENAKIEKFKCDILSNFQTFCG